MSFFQNFNFLILKFNVDWQSSNTMTSRILAEAKLMLTTIIGKEDSYKLHSSKPYPVSTLSSMEPLILSTKSDLTPKFITPPVPKDDPKKDRKNDEALDFSSKPQMFPQSPSVSVHIVKSPSPLINPSPHSASPCITDDELMDEALVGLGK